MKISRRIIIPLCVCLFAHTTICQAKPKNTVKKVKQEIKLKEENASNLVNSIKKLDKDIAAASARIYNLNLKHEKYTKDNYNTKHKLDAIQQEYVLEQKQLLEQLKSIAYVKKAHPLKKLFAYKEPIDLARIDKYEEYILQHKTSKITQAEKKIKATQQQITNYTTTIKSILAEQSQIESNIKTMQLRQKHRENTLKKLQSEIEKNKSILEHEKNIPVKNIKPNNSATSNSSKSLLSINPVYPLDGSRNKKYNFSIANKENRFILNAPTGTKVVAISSGNVLFSNWLKGYGMLTIVEHENGFLSLYGHNQTSFKKPGDVVITGETIALVGQSGGHPDPGLYFEVRHDGTPINLEKWLKNVKKI